MRRMEMHGMTDLEKREQERVAAEAALAKAQRALDGEQSRVEKAKDDLAGVDARLGAADPGDHKQLLKLDGERTGIRIALEVLERSRLPRAEAALAEAEAAAATARRARDAVEKATRFERLKAECARLAAALTHRVQVFKSEVDPLLRELADTRHSGVALAHEMGAAWELDRWPNPSDPGLFWKLEAAAAPPPVRTESAHERMVREGSRRADERFLERIGAAAPPAPRAPVRDSGLTEEQLGLMRAASERRLADHGGPAQPDLPRLVNPNQQAEAAQSHGVKP
jgi:hypothetical protein